MRFATTITLRSADRTALDETVAECKATLERKGVEFNGPHPSPTRTVSVPLYDGARGERCGQWTYTVFTRELEVIGRAGLTRELAERSFPPAVNVEFEVDQVERP
jgi:small subunit ribosomal protein S10